LPRRGDRHRARAGGRRRRRDRGQRDGVDVSPQIVQRDVAV
jgi:hypothetical protein